MHKQPPSQIATSVTATWIITEVRIVLIGRAAGLIGFASLVLNEGIYIGSIGINTRPGGGYRLSYPTRVSAGHSVDLLRPIHRDVAGQIEHAVLAEVDKALYARGSI